MNKKILIIGVLILGVLVLPKINSGECEYGTTYAWVKTLNENGEWGEWKNATVHETLKIHEPFKVKVKITAKVNCGGFSLRIYDYGNAYEVIKGDTIIGESHIVYNLSAGTERIYEWTIRPTGKFTDGEAPLNVRAQFSTLEDDKFVDFTIIAAYIEPEEWGGSINDGDESNGGSGGGGMPGFGGLLTITGILSAGMMVNIFRRNSGIKNG